MAKTITTKQNYITGPYKNPAVFTRYNSFTPKSMKGFDSSKWGGEAPRSNAPKKFQTRKYNNTRKKVFGIK